VHDADGVSDEVMLAFAKETRLVETTFVQSSDTADYRNRIWTPAEELPFAGHPSLGTAVAVALRNGDDEVEYRQQTHAGIQAVRVSRDGDRAYASILQEPAQFGEDVDPADVLAAVGLGPEDAHPALAPQFVSTGLTTLVAPVASAEAVSRARGDWAAVKALADRTYNLYLCAIDGERARARSFMSELADEDPATGSAAGPLMAYANVRLGTQRLDVAQGVEMGRPSRLVAEMEDGRPRVGGDVVVLVTGSLRLPDDAPHVR
jgi:trans-2,3-dihydro-3-hydroxyanthranilate isomerase